MMNNPQVTEKSTDTAQKATDMDEIAAEQHTGTADTTDTIVDNVSAPIEPNNVDTLDTRPDSSPSILLNNVDVGNNNTPEGLIELEFAQGSLGLVLKRQAVNGTIVVSEIIADSQAVEKDVKVGDQLWAVDALVLGFNSFDKDAWNQITKHIKSCPRPLKMLLRRPAAEEIQNGIQIAASSQPATASPSTSSTQSATIDPIIEETTNFKELKAFLLRLHSKERPADVTSILHQDRSIQRRGELSILTKSGLWNKQLKKKFVLLNDMLLITTPIVQGGAEVLQLDNKIDLKLCKLRSDGQVFGGGDPNITHQTDGVNNHFMFQLLHPGGVLDVCAASEELKEVWVLSIYIAICDNVSDGERLLGWRHRYMLGTMHSAVLNRDETRVRELIAQCESGRIDFSTIESTDEDGYAPLHYACILGAHGIIRALHEATADVTIGDSRGLTPLHWAALRLDDYALSLLTEHVFDTDLHDQLGHTPLQLACMEGRNFDGKADSDALARCVTCLLHHKSEIDLLDDYGRNLAHYLAAHWHVDAMNLLFDAGIDPLTSTYPLPRAAGGLQDKSHTRMTALHYAVLPNCIELPFGGASAILNEAGVNTQHTSKTSSEDDWDASSGVETLRSLLKRGCRANFKNGRGKSALTLLLEQENDRGRWGEYWSDAIALLLRFGGRVDDGALQRLKATCTDVNLAASLDKWTTAPVINADALNIKLHHFEELASTAVPTMPDDSKFRSISNAGTDAAPSAVATNSAVNGGDVDNVAAPSCLLCSFVFTLFRRQHHCRLCDALCCDDCSKKRCVVDGAQVRTCDSCYLRVSFVEEAQNRTQVLEGLHPVFGGSSSTKSAISSVAEDIDTTAHLTPSSPPSTSKSPSSATDASSKKDLFGSAYRSITGKPSSSSATASEEATSSLTAAKDTLSEVTQRLQERGEKLSRMQDRTEQLNDQAGEFARLAKQLNDQQKSRWF